MDIYGTYEKQNAYSDGHWLNTIDNSPQMLLSLLRHLVYAAGVNPTNIYLGDPTANFPKYLWDRLHPEFPGVHYFDNYGGQGRMRTEFSAVPFDWSANAAGKLQDYVPGAVRGGGLPDQFRGAQGTQRRGDGLREELVWGAASLPGRLLSGCLRDEPRRHLDQLREHALQHAAAELGGTPGLGHYRGIVDLMGHPALGGKTLLCLVDGLFGGYFWDSHPQKWKMAPFNTNWPSSLFVSQDPVAIDSVCYDFLLNEWPNVVNNGSQPGQRASGRRGGLSA